MWQKVQSAGSQTGRLCIWGLILTQPRDVPAPSFFCLWRNGWSLHHQRSLDWSYSGNLGLWRRVKSTRGCKWLCCSACVTWSDWQWLVGFIWSSLCSEWLQQRGTQRPEFCHSRLDLHNYNEHFTWGHVYDFTYNTLSVSCMVILPHHKPWTFSIVLKKRKRKERKRGNVLRLKWHEDLSPTNIPRVMSVCLCHVNSSCCSGRKQDVTASSSQQQQQHAYGS